MIESGIERQIMIGFVHSKKFIRDILPKYNRKYIESPEVRLIISWSIKHYKAVKTSPKNDLNIYLSKWAEKRDDSDYIELMEMLVESILTERPNNNVDYLISETLEYFDSRLLVLLSKDIELSVREGNLDTAKQYINEYKRVDNIQDNELWLLENKEEMMKAYEEDAQPIMSLSGALGRLLNRHLIRGSFVVFMGHEKVGKTWFLINLAMKAYQQRLNVAYIEAGDMSKAQFLRRVGVYITRGNYMKDYIGEQKIPVVDCEKNQKNTCGMKQRTCDVGINEEDTGILMSFEEAESIGYKACSYCKNKVKYKKQFKGAIWYDKINVPETGWKDMLKKARFWVKKVSSNRRFKFISFPTGTLSVTKLDALLDRWAEEGYIPDVLLIDMIDIMERKDDDRSSLYKNWSGTRAISIDRNMLVFSVTQSDAGSYGKFLLDMKNFSEDKRKYGFVTAMFGLNQVDVDKEEMKMRINEVVIREGASNPKRYVTILQNLSQGRMFIDSF